MRKTLKYIALLFIIIGVSACSSNNKEFDCTANKYEKNPVATIKVKGYGTMKYELLINQAPQSVANFTELANSGFYNGLIFHRLDKSYGIIQGGDPSGTGSSGPGYSIKGEFSANNHCNDLKSEYGTIAMARSQENDSGGSQFYLNFKDNSIPFENNYAVFGKIIEGQDVLEKFKKAKENETTPNPQIIIESITVDTFDQEMPSFEKLKQ